MLKIKDLSTYYFTGERTVKALDGADLSVDRGEFVGLCGNSGCGKSTLGLSVLRLTEPFGRIVGGSIKFEGKELPDLGKEEMRAIRGKSISMVFQDPFTSLNPVISAGEQISECIRHHFDLGKKEAKERAIEALDKVKIRDAKKNYGSFAHELSGGMRQRVMIAIAISCGAKFLIADEITSALDVITQAHIMDLLTELRQKEGLAVLLISHNLPLVKKYCDRTVLMKEGKCLNS